MRTTPIISLLVVAMLSVATINPAHAQRQSLADRMTALEQRAANDRGNLDLLNQLGQLRTEVQQLRALVEELQNQNQLLTQRNRDQYLDLDGRLNRLEGGTAQAAPVLAPTASAAPSLAAPNPGAGGLTGGAIIETRERAPSVHGDVGAMAQAGDERAAYAVAFDALKNASYADASQLFMSFLELYPNGAYAPNALYWLGESYYVTRNYELAAQQFRTLLATFPTHDKASGSMLKLGLAEFGLGEVDRAERTLADVIQRYPGTDVARTADARLRSIQVSRIR